MMKRHRYKDFNYLGYRKHRQNNVQVEQVEFLRDTVIDCILLLCLKGSSLDFALQKYKEFFDTEAKIVGFKSGEGLDQNCIIWILEYQGKTFSCRPRGTREERMEQFKNGSDYIGKLMTVRYQELTDDGLLRFPVAICIRDYE